MLSVSLLVVFLSGFCRGQTENLRAGLWREVFAVDVVAPGASLSTAADDQLVCSRHCLHLESCKTSAFHQQSATCWLYRHLVYYTTTGMASPGTRYFWRLSPSCPGDLGYQLEAGICLKVYTSLMNRTTAEATCQNDGGHLLIADTAAKTRAVRARATATATVLLGGSDTDKEGDWRWVDGSHMTMGSPPWHSGSPNNDGGNENNLELYTNGLFNDVLARPGNAACQIPMQ